MDRTTPRAPASRPLSAVLLLLLGATNSHRNGQWNLSGHFKPGGLKCGLAGYCSHNSRGLYRAEPQLRLHQQEQEVQILCWTTLSLQQKSSSEFFPAECAVHSSGYLAPQKWGTAVLPLVDKSGNCRLPGKRPATPFLWGFLPRPLTTVYAWMVGLQFST